MHIGFIGSGPVATNLSSLLVAAGYTTTLSHRAAPPTFVESVMNADLVVLAIPFRVCADVLPALAPALQGKIVVDATNPLDEHYGPLQLPGHVSAAEIIAELLPGSRVVKAFNSIFAASMRLGRTERNGKPIAAFVCGDDANANQEVLKLARDAGFEPIEVRPLSAALFIEHMAHLNIALAFAMQRGTDGAFSYS